MRALLTSLSDHELDQVHKASLQILKETGIKVLSEKVRMLLAENGAEISGDIVKIPESLVAEALNRAPHEMILGAREPECDLKIPADKFPFISTSGFSPFVDDFRTGERRYSTSADLKDFAILSDYIDTVDFFWPIVIPGDIAPSLQELHSLAISFENNRKHIQCSCVTEKTAEWQVRLATAIAGGEEELKKRPLFSTINCTVAPLVFEKGSSEAMVVLAKAGIPPAPMSMVLAATTGPATIAGTLALGNAEELAALVIIECANPGAPMIYCAEVAPADMKTGEINYNAPEYPLLCAGGAQLARFYKLPKYVADISPQKTPDNAAPPKRKQDDTSTIKRDVAAIALNYTPRPDIFAAFGGLDQAMSASLDQLVLDAEVYEHARAYLRRFEVNDDTLALDIIHKVGPGGHFLSEKHTLEHFKKEIWSRSMDDTFILDPMSKGSFSERAKTKVKEVLSTHKAPPIKEAVHKEMQQILKDAEKDILGNG